MHFPIRLLVSESHRGLRCAVAASLAGGAELVDFQREAINVGATVGGRDTSRLLERNAMVIV